jgi:PEP-CTERM motif
MGPEQKQSLKLKGDNETATSTSGIYTGQASAFISAKGVRGITATAYTTANPPPGGSAAAQAIDPFEVPSGTAYVYDPTVTGSVELDTANAAAGFAAFALDSSVFTTDSLDNFVDDGAPLDQTLWYLSVGSDQPTASISDVFVNFQLNPLALDEIQFSTGFLASLGTYTDTASEVLLIDQTISQFVESQLTRNGSEVDLDTAHLFPAGTMFQPIAGGVEYADAVDAVVTQVPEPGALPLFGFGLAGLFLARYRASA